MNARRVTQRLMPAAPGIRGFSYIEVLVAMALIAVLLVPALDGLHSGVQGGDIHVAEAVLHARMRACMEDLLAQPYVDLEQAADTAGGPAAVVAEYSEAPGSSGRCLAHLAAYDGDNADGDDDSFTGTDGGLLWVKVEMEGTPLSVVTLMAR